MSEYDSFKKRVLAYANKIDGNLKPRFKFDSERGIFSAKCCGVKFLGNSISDVITVRWGSGHQAVVR